MQFAQPDASAIALNRIHDIRASAIDGQLTANGNVWLVNPHGVLFGAVASVNVGGLLATTANISDDRFMSGDYRFDIPGDPGAGIENAGTITVADCGLAVFVAPEVRNSGVIAARLGRVQLGSADIYALDFYGDGLISLAVTEPVSSHVIEQSGRIIAEGGVVLLSAAAAQNTVNGLINVTGAIDVSSAEGSPGSILIYAEGSNAVNGNDPLLKGARDGNSTVLVSGSLDAAGSGAGANGGSIAVLGDHVGIMSGATIDASGNNGGGTIKIGGDYHGEGTTPTARAVLVQSDTSIKADALNAGNGGNVTVWADDYTNFAGQISAKGGGHSGDGGFVETSGKEVLDMSGSVDASSQRGKAGLWLLDPNNATINGSATSNPGYSTSWTAGVGGGNVLNTDIQNSLNGGTSVSIIASGDITVSNTVAKTAGGDATLTLQADGDITVNADITSNTGKLNLYLNADHDANSSGYIDIEANLASNGGNITMGGGAGPITAGGGYAWGNAGNANGGYGVTIGVINDSMVNAGTGNIIINGHGYNHANAFNEGVLLAWGTTGASGLQTTSGNITVNGIGGNGTNLNYGIEVDSTISTSSGAVSLTGTGGAGSGISNIGISVFGTVSSTGTGGGLGTVTLSGTGGNGTQSNQGIDLEGTVSVADANLNITGTGGDGSSSSNYGLVNNGSTQSTGAGTIAMTGYGGHYVNGSTTSSLNWGMVNAGIISGAGTGSVTVIGYGGKGKASNRGLVNAGTISIASGALDVEGYGGVNGTTSTYTSNFGLYNLSSYGIISSTCTSSCGPVTIIGTGAAGYSDNYGVLNQDGTISTVAAALTITGTGGNGTNTGNYGVYNINDGGGAANITSAGAGAITINSTGKNSAVDFVNTGANTIGGGLDTGAITLNQDTATWDTLVTNTSGVLTIAPRSAATTIAVANTNQTLNLDTTFLGNISSRVSEIDIGATTNTGGLTASAYASWANDLKLMTGSGVMTIAGCWPSGA